MREGGYIDLWIRLWICEISLFLYLRRGVLSRCLLRNEFDLLTFFKYRRFAVFVGIINLIHVSMYAWSFTSINAYISLDLSFIYTGWLCECWTVFQHGISFHLKIFTPGKGWICTRFVLTIINKFIHHFSWIKYIKVFNNDYNFVRTIQFLSRNLRFS